MSPDELQLPNVEYSAILPILLLAGGALTLLLMSSLAKVKASQATNSVYTIAVAVAALVSVVPHWSRISEDGAFSAFSGAIANDRFYLFFVVVILSALIIATLSANDWLRARGTVGPEWHVLAMLSATGALIMAAANDLIVVFLGLEILSIALYVLAAFDRRSELSREAALKYLLLGGFSSAIFLYGIALTYGATGSTNITNIATFLAGNYLEQTGLLLAGMVLLVVGFAFKVGAVPFHQWTPDVYQGAPTPVTAFMSAVAKTGAFAAFLRVFIVGFYTFNLEWKPVILALAVATLLLGSVVACLQKNVKRMLAYSSISHAGFILLGLQAATADGVAGSMFYLLAYAFIATGSFTIVSIVAGARDKGHDLESFRGLAKSNPGLALAFTVLLLAQAGVPLTSGFLAKFYVISAQVAEGGYALAVFAMLMAAVAAFFYLRLVFVMYSSADVERPRLNVAPASWLAAGIAVTFTVIIGVAPPELFDAISFARDAGSDLFMTTPEPAAPAGVPVQ